MSQQLVKFIFLSTLWVTYPVQAQSEEQVCSEVITYGQNPQTGEWQTFPTPCAVPDGWKQSLTAPETTETVVATENATVTVADNCEAGITYAQHPTSQKWYIFSKPCEVPTGWKNSQTENVCAEVIVYGQSPKTKTWYPFATPCDIAAQWQVSLLKPENQEEPPADMGPICSDMVVYAQNPKTTNAYSFSTPCDVPDGWETLLAKPAKLMPGDNLDCPPVVTYAQPPGKTNWYAFTTVCEVPAGWSTSATLPQPEVADCSSYKVTYSPTGGKLHIPFIFLNNADTQPAYQGAELELLSSPLFTPYLFFLSQIPKTVEPTQP